MPEKSFFLLLGISSPGAVQLKLKQYTRVLLGTSEMQSPLKF